MIKEIKLEKRKGGQHKIHRIDPCDPVDHVISEIESIGSKLLVPV